MEETGKLFLAGMDKNEATERWNNALLAIEKVQNFDMNHENVPIHFGLLIYGHS